MSKVLKDRGKFKIQRRLGIELPGLGKEGALAKRAYAPGQHGNARRRRPSDYGVRFSEKQKVLFHYGLREKQLVRYVKKAKALHQGEWINALMNMLERRLDNIIFRLGFAGSMPAARQIVRHGNVLVNDRRVDIPSFTVKIGDMIRLTDKMYQNQTYLQGKSRPRLELPPFLEKAAQGDKETGKLVADPTVQDVPFQFEKRFVTEHYFKVKK